MAYLTAAPRRRSFAFLAVALLGAALFGVVVLYQALGANDGGVAPAVNTDSPRVAYFEYGQRADTLWLANPADPSSKERSLTIAHASEYGIVPSLAPGGLRAAYSLLPPETPAPGPDAPAQLWATAIGPGAGPTLLAENVDLLVPAVWSDDAATLVFRRSGGKATEGGYELVAMPADGGDERVLARDPDALFPVAFAGDGSFYFIRLREDGSELLSVPVAGGDVHVAARLSDGLTRDWTLSPDGLHLAYLDVSLGASVSSLARVIDLETAEITPAGDGASDAFSPTWDADGNLVLGQLAPGSEASPLVQVGSGQPVTFTPPSRGFDVPLETEPGGSIAVRSFDGSSAVSPGRAILTVIDGNGNRHEIASGEVTFLGWITS